VLEEYPFLSRAAVGTACAYAQAWPGRGRPSRTARAARSPVGAVGPTRPGSSRPCCRRTRPRRHVLSTVRAPAP
jgi:hypothetical protein